MTVSHGAVVVWGLLGWVGMGAVVVAVMVAAFPDYEFRKGPWWVALAFVVLSAPLVLVVKVAEKLGVPRGR